MRSVTEFRALSRESRQRRRRSGLRGLRVTGDFLRARFVDGPAASAPLLKAKLIEVETGTQVLGEIHWGAVYYWAGLQFGGLLGLGVMSMFFAVTQQAWQPFVIGVPALAVGSMGAVAALRNAEATRASYTTGFQRDLLDAFARK